MLIRNYGLFWRRQFVFWGRPGVSGHLKGCQANAITKGEIDFRYQQGIYCLYDDNFKFVYVGQAGSNDQQRLFDRLKQHKADQLADRWAKFSWFGIRSVNKNGELSAEKSKSHPSIGDVLNHIEAILIAAGEPPHNRQGGRFGQNVTHYRQFRDDDNLGPDLESMVRETYARTIEW